MIACSGFRYRKTFSFPSSSTCVGCLLRVQGVQTCRFQGQPGPLSGFASAMTQKEKILSALAKYGKRPEDMISLKELTAILTMQTRFSTPALTPEQVKVLYKVTDPAGSNSAPCELIAATWSHEPLDRALLMRNTFRTCDFDQSGALRLTSTSAHAHA